MSQIESNFVPSSSFFAVISAIDSSLRPFIMNKIRTRNVCRSEPGRQTIKHKHQFIFWDDNRYAFSLFLPAWPVCCSWFLFDFLVQYSALSNSDINGKWYVTLFYYLFAVFEFLLWLNVNCAKIDQYCIICQCFPFSNEFWIFQFDFFIGPMVVSVVGGRTS